MPIAPAIVAAGIGTMGNVVSTGMTNRANRRLAEYAYSQDLAMWNRQNKYNHPVNQMQRLKDAGLNPNLMYGTGQKASSGVANQMPKYQRPQMVAPQIDPMIFADIELKKSQANALDSQAGLANERRVSEWLKQMVHEATGKKALYEIGSGATRSVLGDYQPLDESLYGERIKLGLDLSRKEIAKIHETTIGLEKDNNYKEWRAALNRQGLDLNDDMNARLAYTLLERHGYAGRTPDVVLTATVLSKLAQLGLGAKAVSNLKGSRLNTENVRKARDSGRAWRRRFE